MAVNGISGNYYGTEYANNKMPGTADRDFADRINDIAKSAESKDAGNDKEKPVFRWLYSANGSAGEVYKAQGYTLEHPVYRVRSWDAAGNLTEHVIDASQVNPGSCNTYEMYVYAADLKETGKGSFEETVMHAVSARAAAGAGQTALNTWDFSKNINWTETAREMMQSAYDCGDLKGYLEWKKFLGFMRQDIFDSMSKLAGSTTKSEETQSDIVVKPDGSRVLVVTVNIGGMETSMSLEISKPADALNETENQKAANGLT